jgi:hypothetical protein
MNFEETALHLLPTLLAMDPPQQISDEQLEDIVLRGKVGYSH